MLRRISRILFYVISVALFYMSYIAVRNMFYVEAIGILVFAIIANPLCGDRIVSKTGAKEIDYSYILKVILTFAGFPFAYVMAIIIFKKLNLSIEDSTFFNFESILKICVYIFYLLLLFCCMNANKLKKYVVFGVFYFFCIILSFSTNIIHKYIIDMINLIPNGNMTKETYDVLISDCLVPIKEAILTHIIFDTVIKKNNKQDIYIKNDENEDIHEKIVHSNTLESSATSVYNISVLDNQNSVCKNYRIMVKK